MDEIECKLATNNAILISHAISKIVALIKQRSEELNGGDVSGVPELATLISKCESSNALISVTACQALTTLVENGVLGIATTLSRFIALLGSTKNYTAVTAAISNLLLLALKIHDDKNPYVCPFTLKAPQHPLITVLNRNKDIWRDILNQMQFMVTYYRKEIAQNSIELLRPVFLYILCNPTSTLSESCKQQTWHLLIKTNHAALLQIETLVWLPTNNANSCINTNYRLLELTELAILNRDKKLYVALTPLVASLALELTRHGCDPRANLEILSEIFKDNENEAASITMAILAELILICPAVYLNNVVRLCASITDNASCNVTSAHMLLASLLQWMAYPSLLSCDALETAKDVVNSIKTRKTWPSNTKRLYGNKIFTTIRYFDSNVTFYLETCRCVESLTDENVILWLENISNAPQDFKHKSKLLLCGIFLQTTSIDVAIKTCHVLLSIVKEINSFASHLLSLVLYKLTNSQDYNETKTLLFSLPELAVVKENVPLIIHYLETLLGYGKPLKQLAIELYLRTWKNEPRSHRYLYAALVDASKNDHSLETSITCARAMKYICETRPEHGAELVPLLSQILNRCSDLKGSAPSALALKGISALCESGVIDICSTWKVLAPKLNKDKRSIVLQSLCDLFGDIPSYPSRPSDNFDKLVVEVITKLWTYIAINESLEVVKAALQALSAYDLELIPLKSLPDNFRKDLKLPESYCKTPVDAARKPELVLPYIPGTCWIQMLENIHAPALQAAGNLLISYITKEINSFRGDIYCPPQGEPNNFRYLPEKSVIRAIGDYVRLSSVSPEDHQKPIIVECLRILSQKYPRPLPPINWVFLQGVLQLNDDTKRYVMSLVCHQMTISPSAKRFVENYLTTFEAVTHLKEYDLVYANLDDLCKGVPPNILRPVLEKTLNYTLEKALMGNDETIDIFKRIMECYKEALKDETIHDANRTLLSIILEGLLDRIEVDNKLFKSYVDTVVELSSKHIERMTSPSVWWEITAQRLQKAILVRAELTLKKDVDLPLAWMNEVIDASITMPGEHVFVLKTMLYVQQKMRSESSTAKWTLELMGRIQAVLADASLEDNDQKAMFLCDVLFVSTICLSGSDCLLTNNESLALSRDLRVSLFPQGIVDLVRNENWRSIVTQIMEWLNHMRKSILPELYTTAFNNTLVLLKHERYFSGN